MANNGNNKDGKDNFNGVNGPFLSSKEASSKPPQFQPGQLPPSLNGNPTSVDQGAPFPHYASGAPTQHLQYIPGSQPPPPRSNAPGSTPYNAADGIESAPPNEIQIRPPSESNGPLANSALLQMLGGTFSRQPWPGADLGANTIYDSQNTIQGPMLISQLNSIAELKIGRASCRERVSSPV